MRQLIYILALLLLCSCSVRTSVIEMKAGEFSNEFISDSLLTKIPTTVGSGFDLTHTDNKNIENKYIVVNEKQLNFFYSPDQLKNMTDYFEEMHIYFYGKRKLGNEKLALFILIDASYLGIYLDCVIIDKEGKLIGKFSPAYIDSDAGYTNTAKGEFLNDSTYKYTEISSAYIDVDHKKETLDSTVSIVIIANKEIHTKLIRKSPTDTILVNNKH